MDIEKLKALSSEDRKGVLESEALSIEEGKYTKPLGEITLYVQDTDPYTTHTIKGELKQDSMLKSFQVNSEKRWDVKEFLKFVNSLRNENPRDGFILLRIIRISFSRGLILREVFRSW